MVRVCRWLRLRIRDNIGRIDHFDHVIFLLSWLPVLDGPRVRRIELSAILRVREPCMRQSFLRREPLGLISGQTTSDERFCSVVDVAPCFAMF